jgi:acyl carrier protein
MTSTERQLIDILNNISRKPDISPDDPLFSSGLLDSFSMLTFLNLVEERFRITIFHDSFDVMDFNTIKMIASSLNKSHNIGNE